MRKIGITLRVENFEAYDERRDAISHEWVEYLSHNKAVPIFIPNNLTNLKEFLQEIKLDGIILSGGDNQGDHPDRDKTEKELIDYGINENIPIIGICRGLQVINNFFGGKIDKDNSKKHVATEHNVKIIDKKFSELLGYKNLIVNSFHKNIILENNLGKKLNIFAKSEDNYVEGIMHEKYPILGVMWHPERNKNKEEINLMKIFYNSLWLK